MLNFEFFVQWVPSWSNKPTFPKTKGILQTTKVEERKLSVSCMTHQTD